MTAGRGDRLFRKMKKGAPLVVIEAMKMEHTISAPADGTVIAVHCRTGDLIDVEFLVVET